MGSSKSKPSGSYESAIRCEYSGRQNLTVMIYFGYCRLGLTEYASTLVSRVNCRLHYTGRWRSLGVSGARELWTKAIGYLLAADGLRSETSFRWERIDLKAITILFLVFTFCSHYPSRSTITFSSYPTSPPPLRRIHEAAGALPRWRNRTVFLCCWVVGILCTGMYSRERGKGGNDGLLDQPVLFKTKGNEVMPLIDGGLKRIVHPLCAKVLVLLRRLTTSSDDALAEVTCVGATAVPTTAASSRLNDGRHLLGSVPSEPSRLREQRCCQHCGAKKIAYETVNFSCSEGAIKLATHPIPDLLKDLLFLSSHESQLFRTCIRTINNQFAFTSLGVKYDQELSKRNRGVYTFRIQESANNLQLYFHDTSHEVSNCLAACPRLTESITVKILKILESNPYAKSGAQKINGQHVIAFVRTFQANGPNYLVVTLYKDTDVEVLFNPHGNEEAIEESPKQSQDVESQVFTPTADHYFKESGVASVTKPCCLKRDMSVKRLSPLLKMDLLQLNCQK
ncbi:tetratricopeptide repeat protein [Striga asiatica]|uniref:Tetratricopeptide repeat protein n=1 Tax=Striga asiatica TaxID=4170 RepID=A0A5A7Q3G2_STRAF|nr:tetratricopeptide repeat protein [Striga asiatica]